MSKAFVSSPFDGDLPVLESLFESGISGATGDRLEPDRASRRMFFGTLAMLFAICTAVTAVWCHSMSGMGGMSMPGGWTMSMTWMRMPGQTWPAAAASFAGMWIAMMAAMMLPSLAPVLWRYHRSLGMIRERSRGRLTMLAGLGYFFVWALLGLAVFPVGVGMATIAMAWPALARIVPAGAGMIVLIAGALQCTKWKARHLALCRNATVRLHWVPDRDGAAWRLGLHIGLHCGLSCANLTAILLVTGVMDLRVMALITAAITAERLAPAGLLVAQSIGLLAVGAGLVSIASAL